MNCSECNSELNSLNVQCELCRENIYINDLCKFCNKCDKKDIIFTHKCILQTNTYKYCFSKMMGHHFKTINCDEKKYIICPLVREKIKYIMIMEEYYASIVLPHKLSDRVYIPGPINDELLLYYNTKSFDNINIEELLDKGRNDRKKDLIESNNKCMNNECIDCKTYILYMDMDIVEYHFKLFQSIIPPIQICDHYGSPCIKCVITMPKKRK